MRRRSRRAEHRRCISATPQRLLWSIATGAEGDHFRSPISSSLPIDSTSLQVVRDDYALLGGASRKEGGCTYARSGLIVSDQHVCPEGVIVGRGHCEWDLVPLLSPSDPPCLSARRERVPAISADLSGDEESGNSRTTFVTSSHSPKIEIAVHHGCDAEQSKSGEACPHAFQSNGKANHWSCKDKTN